MMQDLVTQNRLNEHQGLSSLMSTHGFSSSHHQSSLASSLPSLPSSSSMPQRALAQTLNHSVLPPIPSPLPDLAVPRPQNGNSESGLMRFIGSFDQTQKGAEKKKTPSFSFDKLMNDVANLMNVDANDPVLRQMRDTLLSNRITSWTVLNTLNDTMAVNTLSLPVGPWLALKQELGKYSSPKPPDKPKRKPKEEDQNKRSRKRQRKELTISDVQKKIDNYLKKINHPLGYFQTESTERVYCHICHSSFLLGHSGCVTKLERHILGVSQQGNSSKHMKALAHIQDRQKINEELSNMSHPDDGRKPVVSGSCYCKGVQYSCKHKPRLVLICHCSLCRKTTGGSGIHWAALPQLELTFISKSTMRVYHSSEWAERGFCDKCGCMVYLKFNAEKYTIWITVATMDNFNSIDPQNTRHTFVNSKAPWEVVGDDYQQGTGVASSEWSPPDPCAPTKPPDCASSSSSTSSSSAPSLLSPQVMQQQQLHLQQQQQQELQQQIEQQKQQLQDLQQQHQHQHQQLHQHHQQHQSESVQSHVQHHSQQQHQQQDQHQLQLQQQHQQLSPQAHQQDHQQYQQQPSQTPQQDHQQYQQKPSQTPQQDQQQYQQDQQQYQQQAQTQQDQQYQQQPQTHQQLHQQGQITLQSSDFPPLVLKVVDPEDS
eukprot:CAMPEP_0174267970 /NCGR_PEP_ID=MMETSP0439-20130205/35648_1 /TAXON_ID=0 /ORGANISM="Stereomyxa ramosa, Strain Chinc5" /LENGTH=652 /DNA_ID=CAMNT_0015355827 /DNA_START=208 /DNA_END=2166 /DNA_ORIENTATION=-